MTRKDYQVIATGLVMTVESAFNGIEGYKLTCEYIADELERDNPRFDRVKFLKACGINGATK